MLKMKVFLPTNAEVEWNIKRMPYNYWRLKALGKACH